MKKYDCLWYWKKNYTDELRYSIRSAVKNLHVKRVIIVGDKPDWFVESDRAVYIKSPNLLIQEQGVGAVSIKHIRQAVKSGKLEKEFLLFNDDFFIMSPIRKWVDYHRDEDDYQKNAAGNWAFHKRTLKSLQYTEQQKKFNLHSPMLINVEEFNRIFEFWNKLAQKDIDFRTLYGNACIRKSRPLVDNKVGMEETFDDSKFISTSDTSFTLGYVGRYIRKTFNEPSFCEEQSSKK